MNSWLKSTGRNLMITGILSILRRPCRGGNDAQGEEVSRAKKGKRKRKRKKSNMPLPSKHAVIIGHASVFNGKCLMFQSHLMKADCVFFSDLQAVEEVGGRRC